MRIIRKLLISGRLEIEAVLPSSHTTIKDWMLDSFQSRKAQIKNQMSLANSKINISLDGWRSPDRDDYIAICAHFINEDFKIVHCLLGFRDVKGVKSGQGTAEITAKVINDYEIGDNLGGFMMDNARDNDTALQALAEEFDLDVDFSRLRCLGYVQCWDSEIISAVTYCALQKCCTREESVVPSRTPLFSK